MNSSLLTEEPIHKSIMSMTGPMIIGLFCVLSFNLVDTFFVSSLGSVELAALSLTFPFTLFVTNFSSGFGQGIGALSSFEVGRGNRGEASVISFIGIAYSFALSFIISFLLFSNSESAISFFSSSNETIEKGSDYLKIVSFSYPFFVIQLVGSVVSRAHGNAKIPSNLMMAAAFINLALDPILIFGLGGFSGFGLEGAAYATLFARVICGLWCVYYLKNAGAVSWNTSIGIEDLRSHLSKINSHSWPPMMGQMLYPVTTAILFYMVGQHGDKAVAAYGLVNKLESFFLVGIMALGTISGPFAGQNYGAGRLDRIKDGIGFFFAFCVIWGLAVCLVFSMFGKYIAGVFTEDPVVLFIATVYFTIVPIGYFADGVIRICSTSSTSLKERKVAPSLTFIRGIGTFLPMAILFEYALGLPGLFLSLPVSWLVTSLISAVWLKKIVAKKEAT